MQDACALGATNATAALFDYVNTNVKARKHRVLEAGCGSGVLSIMLARAHPEWDVHGIEIQPHLNAMAQANAEALSLKISFSEADIRSFTSSEQFDLIVSNPPWQKLGHGIQSPNRERAICRSEILCTMPDILDCCSRNLKPEGQAILLYPPSRLADLLQMAPLSGLSLEATVPVDKSCRIYTLRKRIML